MKGLAAGFFAGASARFIGRAGSLATRAAAAKCA
jgi:hypothetical protein